ncbi:MAG: hypothetical protein ACI8RD_000010 [Bacillariaceae sp.]|jgi:hypothetical protein
MAETGKKTVLRLLLQSFLLLVLLGIRENYIRAINIESRSRSIGDNDDSGNSGGDGGDGGGDTSSGINSSPKFTDKGTVNAIYSLIDRVLKNHPKAKDSIRLHIVADDEDINNEDEDEESFLLQNPQRGQRNSHNRRREWYRLEQQNNAINNRNNTTETVIIITATSHSELTAGLGYYFREVRGIKSSNNDVDIIYY